MRRWPSAPSTVRADLWECPHEGWSTLWSEDERGRNKQSVFSPSPAAGKRAITLVPVRRGPADTAALAGEAANAPGAWFEALLDAVPTPLVLVEPVRSRNPDFQPREYLQQLRKTAQVDEKL